jgi:hypothetical protein
MVSIPLIAQEEMSLEQAAQKSNNPVSDAWLLITQNDYTIMYTPEGSQWQNSTTFQPVMPVPIVDGEWNLVNRIITGVVSAPVAEDFDSPNFYDQRTTGNTDTVFFSLAAPNRNDGWIWGVGPTFILPTASQDVIGQERWSAGLLARLGSSFGESGSIESWNIGFLGQQWWDYAGDDDREDVIQSDIQYFLNYKTSATQLIGMTPNIRINWKESGSDRFSVPVGIGTIGLFRMGKVPVRWGAELQYYVQQPDDFGADWNLKLFIAPIAANPFK